MEWSDMVMVPVNILCLLRVPHDRQYPFASKFAYIVVGLPLMYTGALLTFARAGFPALACLDFLGAIIVGVRGSLGKELSVDMSLFCPDFASCGAVEGLFVGLLVEELGWLLVEGSTCLPVVGCVCLDGVDFVCLLSFGRILMSDDE